LLFEPAPDIEIEAGSFSAHGNFDTTFLRQSRQPPSIRPVIQGYHRDYKGMRQISSRSEPRSPPGSLRGENGPFPLHIDTIVPHQIDKNVLFWNSSLSSARTTAPPLGHNKLISITIFT